MGSRWLFLSGLGKTTNRLQRRIDMCLTLMMTDLFKIRPNPFKKLSSVNLTCSLKSVNKVD